jgi:hypothetical protein
MLNNPANTHDTTVSDAAAAVVTAAAANTAAALLTTPLEAKDYLAALVEARKDWEHDCRRATHAGLYALLAKVLRVYEVMAQDNDEGARLRTQLEEACKNEKKNSNTHTVSRLCRLVFDNDRRAASAYSIVLRAAITAGKTSSDVAAWIDASGGVEEIRKNGTGTSRNAASTETVTERAARAYAQLNGTEIAVVQNVNLNTETDLAAVGRRVVLLATQSTNGTYKVHAVLNKENAVDAAFAALASNDRDKDKDRGKSRDRDKKKKDQNNSGSDLAALRDAIVQASGND